MATSASEIGQPAPRLGREAALAGMLVALGAAALVHETVWFRLLVPWLGAGVAPAAVVSAGALLGFTIGAYVGGIAADRTQVPLRVLAVAEGAAALLALAIPSLFDAASSLRGMPAVLTATLFVTLAATPMGASLPAAVRALAPDRDRVAPVFRRLYGWNTLGAVLGVVMATVSLLETFGNRGSLRIAAAAQGLVALLALLFPAVASRPPVPRETGSSSVVSVRLLVASALAGAAGLAIQVAWIRRLTSVLGSTYQLFAAVLAIHLLAMAVGPWIFGPRRRTVARNSALVVAFLAAIPVVVLPGFVDDVGRFAAGHSGWAGGSSIRLLGIRVLAAAILVLPSTILGSALLAWLLRIAAPQAHDAGRATGALTATNCAGAAITALFAALVWIPAVGTAAVLRGAGGLYLACAALLAGRRLAPLAFGLAALLLAAPVFGVVRDHALRDGIGVLYDPGAYDPADAEVVYFREGAVSTVVVRDRDGRREFWVDGSIESSTGPTDRLHLALLGHLPMALRAGSGGATDRVAVIGLGAGFTAHAVAAWKPKEEWIFELEPAVAVAARTMVADGGGVPVGSHLVLSDGRRGLVDAGGRFDVVTTDPIHPAIAGSASLYSLEAYRSVAEHLAPGGIFCQWLPIAQMAEADVRLVLRTFASAVPAPYLFMAGADGILIGASAPLRLDEARLRSALAGPAGAELAEPGLRSPGALLSLLSRRPDGLALLTAGEERNTDDRLLLEFRCGRGAGTADGGDFARRLGTEREDGASLLGGGLATPEFLAEGTALAPFRAGLVSGVERDFGTAARLFADAAKANPDAHLVARLRDEATIEAGFAFLSYGDKKEAGRIARDVLERGAEDPILRLDAAELLLAAGRANESRDAARAVLRDGTDSRRARRLAAGR